jgi:hypothetical protein
VNRRERIRLRLQYVSGRTALWVTAPLTVLLIRLAGYRVNGLEKFRERVRELFTEHPGPWLICANHLTLIDSVILAYAMFPFHRYMTAFRLLPWNLPEKRNFQRNAAVGLLCYLLKCVPVVRGGSREAVRACLDKCDYLLEHGENIMVFPEGTRSRSGRVNTAAFSYGPGRMVHNHPACRVLCVYLRGERQKACSDFPALREKFRITAEPCQCGSDLSGLRAHRECSRQIIEKLAQMEAACLNVRGQ